MDASPSPTIEIHPGPVDAEGRATADFAYIADEGWGAVGKLVYSSSTGVAIREITISGKPFEDEDLVAITSNVLRHVPTGKILASALAVFTNTADLPDPDLPPRSEKRQPGRQPLSDDLLQSLAEAYLRETGPDMPRGAISRLAEAFDKPTPTISRWVMRARADGWLGPAVPGREGAEPGPRLLAKRDFRQRGVGGHPRPHEVKADQPGGQQDGE